MVKEETNAKYKLFFIDFENLSNFLFNYSISKHVIWESTLP
jgi:hypothetical protein